jgi:hypothetical protein
MTWNDEIVCEYQGTKISRGGRSRTPIMLTAPQTPKTKELSERERNGNQSGGLHKSQGMVQMVAAPA